MTIDKDTAYSLTGEQIEELVDEVKGAKITTINLSNTASENPTLAVLPAGLYQFNTPVSGSVTVTVAGSTTTSLADGATALALISATGARRSDGLASQTIVWIAPNSSVYRAWRINDFSGAKSAKAIDFLLSDSVINVLTNTRTDVPLSAYQGKVLNDKIAALEARVEALEGE